MRSADRRKFLTHTAAAGAAVWVAPTILSTAPLAAAGSPPTERCTGSRTSYSENFNDGVFDSGWSSNAKIATSPNGSKFLGEFGNESVSLTFSDLADHSLLTVMFRLYIIRTWDGNCAVIGPDRFSFEIDGANQLSTTFSHNAACTQDYPTPGSPARAGACEINALGYSATDPLSGDSSYCLSFTIPHTACSMTATWTASNLQGIADESWGIDHVAVTVS